MDINNIGSLSMKGGRNDNFYFCLIEYYPDSQRWFLKSLLSVKDEEALDNDDAIHAWINNFNVKQLVVDFPLSKPASESANSEECIKNVKEKIKDLLNEDQKLINTNPKKYEQERNKADEIVYNRDIFLKETSHHLLSRSFKRRLKKGFLPYWNRALDFWVWKYYYDQILELFNTSFDSFGNVSLMVLYRFNYIKRHFPQEIELFEANEQIILVELLRSKVIMKKDVAMLSDIDLGIEVRLETIKKIESKLDIFIYNHDLEILVKNPRAFDSFILALAGQNVLQGKNRELPDWTMPQETKFIIPNFG
jgi:RNase H-fold protein (predicted Holliday junction resolvase)